MDVTTLGELLREAEERHGQYEATAPPHHWSDWYAAYIVARETGGGAEESASSADQHTEAVLAVTKEHDVPVGAGGSPFERGDGTSGP